MEITYEASGHWEDGTKQSFTRHHTITGAPRFVFELGSAFQPEHVRMRWEFTSRFLDQPDAWHAAVSVSGPRVLKSGKLSERFTDTEDWDDSWSPQRTADIPEWLRPQFEQVRAEFEAWRPGPVNALLEAAVKEAAHRLRSKLDLPDNAYAQAMYDGAVKVAQAVHDAHRKLDPIRKQSPDTIEMIETAAALLPDYRS